MHATKLRTLFAAKMLELIGVFYSLVWHVRNLDISSSAVDWFWIISRNSTRKKSMARMQTHTHCWFIGIVNDFPFDLLNGNANVRQHKCNRRISVFESIFRQPKCISARLMSLSVSLFEFGICRALNLIERNVAALICAHSETNRRWWIHSMMGGASVPACLPASVCVCAICTSHCIHYKQYTHTSNIHLN